MRVLVIGSGGREHALVKALLEAPSVTAVFALPGSDGIAATGEEGNRRVECLPGDPLNGTAVLGAVREHRIELVVVGPEAPLAAGLADRLAAAGVPVFGPRRAAARLEWSKAFAKEFMARHGIPTAPGRVFDDPGAAEDYIRRHGGPLVVKADGLAGGKGVTVAATAAEAAAAVDALMRRGRFGAAGHRVVIEERLTGPEVSVLAVTDGVTCVTCPAAQDHKAVYDGGRGPNTGGMGAYSPVPFVDGASLAAIEERILRPTLAGLAAEGIDYRGVLYAGLMLTEEGPFVLEFNCRFGDPETQALLPRFAGDLGALLAAAAEGRLGPPTAAWRSEAAVCVVLCSGGYPGDHATGLPISGLAEASRLAGVHIYHAGTARTPEGWVTAGGRVLNVTGLAPSLAEARRRAYEAASRVHFPAVHYRRDIAAAAGN